MESKVKKTCADYDLAILRPYRYIPVYTKYNLVYTMWVQTQWQLSYFLFQDSVLLLDHASMHPPCTVQRSLQPKVKKTRVQAIRYVGLLHSCIYQYILRIASIKTIIFSSFHKIFLEKNIVFFCSGNFEAVRRACPGPIWKLLRSRTKTHCWHSARRWHGTRSIPHRFSQSARGPVSWNLKIAPVP